MTVAIDFVCLLPINSWRRLYANDVGLSSNYALIDDSIDDLTYYYYTIDDVSRTFLNKIIGSPLMLQPNTAQKLYFLTEQPVSGTNTHTIAATATVMLSYRPRKLTLN